MNDLLWLSGTWFVAASNHPMWTSGKKEAPTYTFTPVEAQHGQWLSEEIKYVENEEVHSIHGEDFPAKNNFRSFTWRGKSPDGVHESRWEVKLVDETGLWVLTWCEGNERVPEHVHILIKEIRLENDVFEKINKLMLSDAVLEKHAGTLKKLL